MHQEGIASVLASRLFMFIHAIEGHHRGVAQPSMAIDAHALRGSGITNEEGLQMTGSAAFEVKEERPLAAMSHSAALCRLPIGD